MPSWRSASPTLISLPAILERTNGSSGRYDRVASEQDMPPVLEHARKSPSIYFAEFTGLLRNCAREAYPASDARLEPVKSTRCIPHRIQFFRDSAGKTSDEKSSLAQRQA